MVSNVNKRTGGIQGHFSFSEMFVCSIASTGKKLSVIAMSSRFFVIITAANIESKHL